MAVVFHLHAVLALNCEEKCFYSKEKDQGTTSYATICPLNTTT